MKVLLLHKFNLNHGWGGSASYLLALCRAFKELGHEVRVVTRQFPDRFGVTTSQLPYSYNLTFGPERRPGEMLIDELTNGELYDTAIKAAEVASRNEFTDGLPSIILANHINLMALVAWQLWRRFNVPYRIISYGTDTLLLMRNSRYVEMFGEAARHANQILAISNYVAEQVRQTVGGNVTVLGGAVDERHFYRIASQPAARRLVYVGRLVTEKGIMTLLEAFEVQRLADELLIVGEGPLRDQLQKIANTSKHRDRIKFLGFVPPECLREILQTAAAVVVPSTWDEPLGLVVLEAMACGVPVIASSVGGIPEMVINEENGLLVPPGNASALAASIDRLLGEPVTYRRIREGAERTLVPTYRDLAKIAIGNLA